MGPITKISIRVYPNAPKTELVGSEGGTLRLKLAAPAERGKANRELLAFLSRLLGVSPLSLTITKGRTSRYKTVAVKGLSQDEVRQRLKA